jgi:NADPH-dependent 7-cyano-7-deazaguanine reductase QueF
MNLLEHYIVEVHNILESKTNPEWIEVDVTTNCWGNISRHKHITTKKRWEYDLKQGYYIA